MHNVHSCHSNFLKKNFALIGVETRVALEIALDAPCTSVSGGMDSNPLSHDVEMTMISYTKAHCRTQCIASLKEEHGIVAELQHALV